MLISFEESLERIFKEISPSSEYCQSLNMDAEEIGKLLVKKMKEYDSVFNEDFQELSLPRTYRFGTTLPDELDFYIKLKLPFNVTLYPGQVIELNTNIKHPIVHHKRICSECLRNWIRKILIKVICRGIYHSVGGRIYMIEYPKVGYGYGVAHTILVKEVLPGKCEFSVNFLPAFGFRRNFQDNDDNDNDDDMSYIAVPFGKKLDRSERVRPNEFSFIACKPHCNDVIFEEKPNLKKSLRLIKALCNAIKVECLTSYLLKSFYLCEIEDRPIKFCNQPIGVILVEMVEALMIGLSDGKFRFFFKEGFHNFDLLAKQTVDMCSALDYVFLNLNYCQQKKFVNHEDVAALFKRKHFEKKYGTACLLFRLICEKNNSGSSK